MVENKRDENERGCAEHVQPQHPACRRRCRHLQPQRSSHRRSLRRRVEYRQAGAEVPRAEDCDYNKSDDYKQEDDHLAQKLNGHGGSSKQQRF